MLETMHPPNSNILATPRNEDHKQSEVKQKQLGQGQSNKTQHNNNNNVTKKKNTYQVINRKRYHNNNNNNNNINNNNHNNNNYSNHSHSKKFSIAPQQQQQKHLQGVGSSENTKVATKVMSSNIPNSIAVPASTSPTYTLDFLHYVGVQMNATGNGIVNSAIIDPDFVTPACYVDAQVITSSNSNCNSTNPNNNNNNNNNNNKTTNNNKNDLNNCLIQRRGISGSVSSTVDNSKEDQSKVMQTGPIQSRLGNPDLCHHMNYQVVATATVALQQQQQQPHQQQQPQSTNLFHNGQAHHFQHHHLHHHPSQSSQHQQHLQNFHMNNNYHHNNRNYNNNNNNGGPKRSWNSNYQKIKKSTGPTNNNNNNNNSNSANSSSNSLKYTTVAASGGSTTGSSTSNNNNQSSQQRHQISRTLSYVNLSSSECNSPIRETKSESPSLPLTGGGGTIPHSRKIPASLLPSGSGGISSSNHLMTTSMPSMISTSCLPLEYDSDSSHSSFHYRDYLCSQYGGIPENSMSTTSNHSRQSNDDSPFVRSHFSYFGSQQNLSIWQTNSFHHQRFGHGFYGCQSDERISINGNDGEYHKRSYSERSSPQGHKNYRGGRKHNHQQYTYNSRLSNYNENNHHLYTPPDRFLTRAHLVEIKRAPDALLNNSKWDKLSQMVWDKFRTAQQSEDTYKKKMYLWRYLYLCVKKFYPKYGLYLVGSTISGFGSDSSDVDMCLVARPITDLDPRQEALMHLTHLQEHLTCTTGIFDTFNLIQAKVPILRFKDSLHLLEVDLNFNNSVGIRNTHLLYCYSQMDWRLRPLALVVKLWAQFHHINNAKDMTISSYSLVLMTIHFLQCAIEPPVLPCLHALYPQKFLKLQDINNIDMNEDLDPYHSDNKQSLGELFLQFLQYYSTFDYSQCAISIRTAGVLPIEKCRLTPSPKNDPHQWNELCIEEPFDLTNTARSVYDREIFERIKSVFITSWQKLQETMDLSALFSESFLLASTSSRSTSPS